MAEEDKERLDTNEFAELIPHLPLKDLLRIEYYVDKWSLLIHNKPNNNIFTCKLCGVCFSGSKNLYAHIDGKKHKLKMSTIKKLFHPDYTYPRNAGAGNSNMVKNPAATSAAKTTGKVAASAKAGSPAAGKATPPPTGVAKPANSSEANKATISTKSAEAVKANAAKTTAVAGKVAVSAKAASPAAGKATPPPIGAAKAANSSDTNKVVTTKIVEETVKPNTSVSNANNKEVKEVSKPVAITKPAISKPVEAVKPAVTTKPTAASNKEVSKAAEVAKPLAANTTAFTTTKSPEEASVSKSVEVAKAQIKPKPEVPVKPTATQAKAANESKPTESAKSKVDTTVSVAEPKKPMPTQSNSVAVNKPAPKPTVTSPKVQEIEEEINTTSKVVPASTKINVNLKSNEITENEDTKVKVGTIKVVNIASLMVVNPAAQAAAKLAANENKSKQKELPKVVKNTIKKISPPPVKKVPSPVMAPKASEKLIPSTVVAPKAAEKQKHIQVPKDVITLDDESDNNDEPSSKRSKIVVNPAAALLERAGAVESTDKPQYQQDRIIIPTVHKNKPASTSSQDKPKPSTESKSSSVQNPFAGAPYFAVKTFSSKSSGNEVRGLVGVEYVVKIMKDRADESPRYECGLCELLLNGVAMQNHLMSYEHRLKFCEKHFPSAIRQYRSYMGNLHLDEYFKVMPRIMEKLAIAIEKHHGRDLPYECLSSNFSINRHEVLSHVYSTRHASEQVGPTFTHVVDSKQVDRYIAERHRWKPPATLNENSFDSKPSVSRNRHRRDKTPERNSKSRFDRKSPPTVENIFAGGIPNNYAMYHTASTFQPHFAMGYNPHMMAPAPGYVEPSTAMDDATHKMMVEDFLRTKGSTSASSTTTSSARDRDRRTSRRSRSPPRSFRQRRERSRSKSRKSISPLRDNDIWQAYRHMVDQKLLQLNVSFADYRKDPDNHPQYNDEWQKFWKRRKDELISAGLDHRTYNYQPEWVRFFKVRIEELYSLEAENIKVQCRERLCLPMSNDYLRDAKYHVTAATKSTVQKVAEEDQSQVGVVSVLRLLTALEEHLGSLGPKIVDLLSKALQTEKTHPTELNCIMLTVENCAMLETAMEKFRGLVMAGIMEGSKERALKKAIVLVEKLLVIGEEERKAQAATQTPKFGQAPHAPQHVSSTNQALPQAVRQPAAKPIVPTVAAKPTTSLGIANKKELAAKLAAALAAQGKTDFDPQQLQQLIAVYSVIEKKRREADAQAQSQAQAQAQASAASSSKQKTLSDSLSELLNFKSSSRPEVSSAKPSVSNTVREASTTPPGSNAYTAEAVSNYIDMMRRGGSSTQSQNTTKSVESEVVMWDDLRNIQQNISNNSSSQQEQVNDYTTDSFVTPAQNYPYHGYPNMGYMHDPYGAHGYNMPAAPPHYNHPHVAPNMMGGGGDFLMPPHSMGAHFNNTNNTNPNRGRVDGNIINIGLGAANTPQQQQQRLVQMQQQQQQQQRNKQQGNQNKNKKNQGRR